MILHQGLSLLHWSLSPLLLLALLQDREVASPRVTGETTDPSISILAQQDTTIKNRSVEELVRMGEAAVEPLIEALRDKDNNVRCNAALALGKIGDRRAVEPLIRTLEDEDMYVREYAAEALGALGDRRAVEPLAQAMNKGTIDTVQVALTLAGMGDKRAVIPLLRKQKDIGSSFRDWFADLSVNIVVAIGDSAMEPLLECLRDEKAYVRVSAIRALGRLGKEQAAEPIVSMLNDEHTSVRAAAAEALGRLGQKESVQSLIDVLRDKDWTVRKNAVGALRRFKEQRSVPGLIEALKDEKNDVRSDAAIVLGEIGDSRSIAPLIQALTDTDDGVRSAAASALGSLADEQALEPLVQALKDENKDVRGSASFALGKLGDKRAFESIVVMLGDQDRSVRESAAEALGVLGDLRAISALDEVLSGGSVDTNTVAASLAKLGDRRGVRLLLNTLADESKTVAELGYAYEMLAEAGKPVVGPLIELLRDADSSVRASAAHILSEIGDKRAIQPLEDTLKNDEDEQVRKAAAEALKRLQGGK